MENNSFDNLKGYNGNPLLKKTNQSIEWTPEMVSDEDYKTLLKKKFQNALESAGLGSVVGKASQVTETIGSGDEMMNSMSDQKEDELKKKGISLTTFKKRNYV